VVFGANQGEKLPLQSDTHAVGLTPTVGGISGGSQRVQAQPARRQPVETGPACKGQPRKLESMVFGANQGAILLLQSDTHAVGLTPTVGGISGGSQRVQAQPAKDSPENWNQWFSGRIKVQYFRFNRTRTRSG